MAGGLYKLIMQYITIILQYICKISGFYISVNFEHKISKVNKNNFISTIILVAKTVVITNLMTEHDLSFVERYSLLAYVFILRPSFSIITSVIKKKMFLTIVCHLFLNTHAPYIMVYKMII